MWTDEHPKAGHCVFCSRYVAALTKEDAIPKWLVKQMHDNGFAPPRERRIRAEVNNPNSDPQIYRFNAMKPTGHMHTHTVCESYNTGWMSALEKSFKPIFDALLTTPPPWNVPHSFRLTMSRWAFKTTVALLAQHYEQTGLLYVSRTARAALVTGGLPQHLDIRMMPLSRSQSHGMGVTFRSFATSVHLMGTYRYAGMFFTYTGPLVFAIRYADAFDTAARLVSLTPEINDWPRLTPQLVVDYSETIRVVDVLPDVVSILDGIPEENVSEEPWIELVWDRMGIPPDERP